MRAYSLALLGLKMLPEHMGKEFSEFYAEIEARGQEAIEAAIRHAVSFVALEDEEIENVLAFVTDANGVPISSANIKNLGPNEIKEAIVAVFIEISKIKVNLVTSEEKKN
jgi:hypothetical protein